MDNNNIIKGVCGMLRKVSSFVTMSLCYFVTLSLFLSSCSSKKLAYLNNADVNTVIEITENYDLKIKKDDQLSIIVNSREPALAAHFNMMLTNRDFAGSSMVSTGQGGTPQKFIVDSDGNINYPLFGKLNVIGMTRSELADSISGMLSNNGYIQDPVVNVNIGNFKISVLGEVQRPGIYDIDSERITIFEAISRAGDLTVYGRRNKVKLLREVDGQRVVKELNLNDSSILTSPDYYLAQNDVIYIEPNAVKASQRSYSALWGTVMSIISIGTTIGLYFAK